MGSEGAIGCTAQFPPFNLDAVVSQVGGKPRQLWWETAGSKLPEKYANAASGPSLQVESKFSYALELVNLEQQKAYYEIQK